MTRTERTYYLVQALYHFSWSFLGPAYALFLLSRGLDLLEINLVFATYLVTAFLFEVPTGAVADVFGRKTSFLLSCFVRMAAFLLYAFSDSFGEFLFAECIDAIGTTLATGALDAWAVDGMCAEGSTRPAERLFARAQMLARGFMIVSGLGAGYVAGYGIHLPWFVAAGGFGVTGVVAAILMQDDRTGVRRTFRSFLAAGSSVLTAVRSGWRDVRGNSTLAGLCTLTFVISVATMPAFQTWQPRMEGLSGQSFPLMGWIFALLNGVAIVGSIVVTRLQSLPRRWVLAAATSTRALGLAAAALATTFVPALAGFLVFELGFAVSEPLFLAWANEHAPPERRATVLSVRAMAFTLGGGVGLCCIGLIARSAGIAAAWLTSALVLGLAVPGFFWLGKAAAGQAKSRTLPVPP